MSTPSTHTQLSKFVSLVLRHDPAVIGATLDAQGWLPVAVLIQGAKDKGLPLSLEGLHEIVRQCPKQRFRLSEDGQHIRANQGHSLPVDLQLASVEPPDELLHGTADRFLAAILKEGLVRGSRQHVHLTTSRETALSVGSRYGRVVLLSIDARRMRQEGHPFFRSDNGVWLTDHVPPECLAVLPSETRASHSSGAVQNESTT